MCYAGSEKWTGGPASPAAAVRTQQKPVSFLREGIYGMKKRIISLLLVFALLVTLLPTGAMAAETAAKDSGTNPFTDVKSTDWFYDAVRYAGEKGFFSGTSATTFEPYGTMTRGMFVTVLGRMAGVNAGDYTGGTGFSDVPEAVYYAPYVAWAAQYGITGGTGDGKFSPNAFINRQQMAAFFVRYFEAFGVNYETGANITTTPADLDTVAPYARDAVLKLWKQGLLNGDGVNFSPTGSATRAQASTLCMRTDKTVPVWYSAPGVEGRTGGAEPAAPAKPEQKPGSSSGSSSSGGSSSGGGTTTTTYYAVSFAMGDKQPEIGLPESKTVAAGTPISSLPTPSKPGVVFLGWYYDKEMTRSVGAGDTVTRNMTLYASVAAGEDVQGIETPNYVTIEKDAGPFSFGVTAENKINASVLKFINITDVNTPVDFSVSGSTVSAALEAGQTYKVELLDENARFVLDGTEQDASVRVLNILTAKAKVTEAKLNEDVKQIPISDTEGLDDTVFKGLYQIDDTQTVSENTTSGAFTYTGTEPLTVGQTLAVTDNKNGTVDLNDVTSDSGDVAYIKITGVNGNNGYSYEMADVEDVLFIPDVLPIQNGWDTDSSKNTVTISADDLNTALNNVDAAGLDEGDFLAFIDGAYNSESDTANSYGRVTAFAQSGKDYVITYVDATENDIESALDVYYEEKKDIKVSKEEEEQIAESVTQGIEESGYAEKAVSYIMAVMEESGGLDTAPDPAAVAAYMDTISTYARADGSIVLYAGGRKAEAKVDWSRVRVSIDRYADHLKGGGFDIEVTVPITLEMDSVTVDFTAVFEEEVILGQSISTKRHKIGFLKYDYSLNASFDIGNYTGIHFKADVRTQDGGNDESLSKKLDEILDKMEAYGGLLESGGVSGTDGTMESLSDIYKEVMDSASDAWVDVINQKLFENNGSAFLHIFCWQIKGSFVVSVNMAVTMGMDFEYTTRKRYNFSVRVKAKTSTNETIDLITPNYTFNFYVIGTIGVRAGLRLEMYVGLISLKIDRIGIVAEVGVYTQLWGYFFYHLEWKQGAGKKSNSAGALLIEIGMYLDIKFVATLFNSSKLTWAPTIYANQWPLWSAGQRQNVFAFADSGRAYELKTAKTLALPGSTYTMKSMDLKTGGIGVVNKDDNSESAFAIAFTNPNFSYNAATNTVTVNPTTGSLNEETDMVITWKKAAMAFTSKPIQKTLHIKWSDPEGMRYISFDSMGGSAVAQITGGEGARINWPADPTKPGYTFAGWYKNPSFENSRVEKMDTMPKFFGATKGMLLFAKWTPAEAGYTVEHYQQALNGTYELKETEKARGITESRTMAAAKTYTGFTAKAFDQQTIAADGSTVVKIYYDRNQYTVTWNPENGTENIVQTYKYDAKLNTPTVGREGYLFTGWGVTLPEKVTGDAVYTARWEGVQNPVTFNAMGGSETAATTVQTGERITRPADPTRDGYAFGGWYSDQNCTKKWDFSTAVTGAVTLFTKWTASAYTVTLNPRDGQLMGDSTRTVTFGQPYGELPTPTLQGYNFAGWYTANDDSGKKVEADTVVETAGAHTLYAKWTPGDVAYTVKHLWQNVEDNEYTEHESDSLTGTVMTETAAKAKTYEGFGPAKEFAQTTIAPDGTTVIEIKYDRLTYTVTWKNGETLLETDENVKYGAKPQYDGQTPEKTETGHTITFSGWNTAADGSGTALDDTVTVAGDATYYAQFSDSLDTYRITYQNMGDAENPNPDSYTYGTAVTLEAPTRTGYTFGGWYRNSDAAGDPITGISATETGDQTLYAKWTANTYTVTFDVNGGETLPENQKTLTVTYGSTYGSLPTPAKEGSAFDGWYTDGAAGEKVTAGTTVQIVEDQTLYAHWTAGSYTITFKTAGGSEVEPITGTFGTPVTKPADPTRTGYTFTGWDKEIPAAMPAKDMTITARWTANTYTVTLNPTGGTVADESITVTYDGTYGTLPTPVRQGCTFTGWFTEKDSGSKVEPSTPVSRTEDHTLYARWVEDATKYDLWIGGVQVTGGSAQDVFGNGTVSYDPDRNILTLNNYSYTGDGTASISNATIGDACLGYKGSETRSETLTIKLVGTNRLTFNGRSTFSNGIYIQRANLVIEGPGSLTVDVAGTMPDGVSYYRSFSICVTEMGNKGGTMTINGGTITTTGDAINKANVRDSTHGSSIGLAAQTLIVNGGSLTARGGDVTLAGGNNIFASSCGISVPYNKLTINGGSVTASCGTAHITESVGSEGMSAFDYQPILGEGITAQVSTNRDGSGAIAYDAKVDQDVFRTYRWFHASKT